MTTSIDDAFAAFLSKQAPSDAERTAAREMRAEVEGELKTTYGVTLSETGSLTHGTAVRGHCDADYFAVFERTRPDRSDTALRWIKDPFHMPFTWWYKISIHRPAVVFERNARLEVVPAFRADSSGGWEVFDIPAPGGEWMRSAPKAHLAYVTSANQLAPHGRAKHLARLLKVWKYKNRVPISSFYLEMRAAEFVNARAVRSAPVAVQKDLADLMDELVGLELRNMNDPEGLGARIAPCSSVASLAGSKSAISRAAHAANAAITAENQLKYDRAHRNWGTVFGSSFPGQYSWLFG